MAFASVMKRMCCVRSKSKWTLKVSGPGSLRPDRYSFELPGLSPSVTLTRSFVKLGPLKSITLPKVSVQVCGLPELPTRILHVLLVRLAIWVSLLGQGDGGHQPP